MFPCPVERLHGRRLKRHRAPQLLEEEDEEEDEGRDKEEMEQKKIKQWKEREESQSSSCLEEGAENGQKETYVILSSPETQEELGVCTVCFSLFQVTCIRSHNVRCNSSQHNQTVMYLMRFIWLVCKVKL